MNFSSKRLYVVLAAIGSVLGGYGTAICAMWVVTLSRFGQADFAATLQEYVAGQYGRFLLLLCVAFGLPHLVIPSGLKANAPFGRAAAGGMAVGLSIAAGFSLLFVVLGTGGGSGWFIADSLLFGAVAGFVAVNIFRLLGVSAPDARLTSAAELSREPALIKRVAISAGALAVSCGALCVLFSAGAAIFDRYDSVTRWLPLYGFFAAFSLTGWFLFGLPILTVGPLRRRFRKPLASAVAGGAAGVVLIEAFYHTQFTSGGGNSVWEELAINGGFGLGAFLVGALTTYLYVHFRESSERHLLGFSSGRR